MNHCSCHHYFYDASMSCVRCFLPLDTWEWRNILHEHEHQGMEKKQQEETLAKEISEGKIYGTDYARYDEDDIKKITDIDFLESMFSAILPAAQPRFEWEVEMLCHLQCAIRTRIDELENKWFS